MAATTNTMVFEALADPPQKEPIEPIIALRKDARIQQHGNTKAAPGSDPARDPQERTQGLETKSGYHRRSLVETQMFRYKRIIGDKLRARTLANQQVERRLGCAILNRMTHLGRPESYKVEKVN